jgi:RNA polymerase sigma-70 factor (sigma-E family)
MRKIGREAKQRTALSRVFLGVDGDDRAAGALVQAVSLPGRRALRDDAAAAVEAIYQATALSLIRMAYVMLDDRPSAEDVVQEAFCGLYRRWEHVQDPDRALHYVRRSVLNGCRSALRRRAVRRRELPGVPPLAASAEAEVLIGEERDDVVRALGQLPHRQREVLVLRFYLELPDEQIARVMGIGQSTVRSTAFRALEALGRALGEGP